MRHALILLAAGLIAASAAAKPNVIVFLSDDVGYGEYGFQGNKEIPTPNIDSIAKNGVRFTQGYVAAPYCSPMPGRADDRPLPDAVRPRVQRAAARAGGKRLRPAGRPRRRSPTG